MASYGHELSIRNGLYLKDGAVRTPQLSGSTITSLTEKASTGLTYPDTNGKLFYKSYGSNPIELTSGLSIREQITQSSHGFTAGQVLYFNGTTYALAQSNAVVTAETIGIVESVVDTNNFIIVYNGRINVASASWTPGTVYYLSASTAGALANTEPSTGNVVKAMLIATSATSGLVLQYLGTITVVSNFQNSSLNASSSVILDSIAQTDTFACQWMIAACASDQSAIRTGTVDAAWSSTNQTIEYTEYTTKDLGGSTSDISFTVTLSGGYVNLNAINGGSLNGWIVKAKRIEI